MAPRVAVVGRQNVGKSTLVNRLVGRREAIADERPGVTRDRVELRTSWRGRAFTLVDTGGYVRRPSGIDALVSAQAEVASRGAAVILLVVDGRTGIAEEDAALVRGLRASAVPILVVVNKIDTEADEPDVAAFHALGLGDPVPVSALHGRGSGDLLDRVIGLLPEADAEPEVEGEPRFAIVGRPNVGKSSLFNRLVGEERSVVYEEAGTTRDSIDAVVAWETGRVRFVDTAGFRRPSRVRGVDYYGFVRTVRAVDRADVAVLVLDAPDGFTTADRRIAARVMDSGRGLTIAANKWDLVEESEKAHRSLLEAAALFANPSVSRVSALTGAGVGRLPGTLLDLHRRWMTRVSTADVNRVLQAVQSERPAPHPTGRILYGTQVAGGPPAFVLFGGEPPGLSYRRFLENRLRRAFGFDGIPIRLRFRSRRRGAKTSA